MEEDWQIVCSDSVMRGVKLCQIPFYNGKGSFICRACFNLCQQGSAQDYKKTEHYFLPFQCQCQHLG
jgi:hypothetical protein